MEREAIGVKGVAFREEKCRVKRYIVAAANVMSADRTRRHLKVPDIKGC
jgi:hypothetical protein